MTGNCASTIKMSSLFKICCPTNQMYHASTGQCVDTRNHNCDQKHQVCCNQGEKMEFLSGKFICVNMCSWGNWPSSNLFCQKRLCERNRVVMIGPKEN